MEFDMIKLGNFAYFLLGSLSFALVLFEVCMHDYYFHRVSDN
jgi:hypothetical protein